MLSSEIEFINYTDTFREYGDKVLLKIHHSLRVENLCRDIAEKTGLSSSSIDLSGKCGLLHDIGRFEQWRKYGTYNDSKSTDHGDLGASILKNNSLISKFTAEDQETIINTAKYHNKYSVPFDLNERNGLFVHMTRDADKLDIFYLSSLNELHVNTHDSKISEKVYDLIMNHQNISRDDINTKADALAMRLSFVFGLKFNRSFEIMKENDYLNSVFDNQTKSGSPELSAQLESLRTALNAFINKKSCS